MKSKMVISGINLHEGGPLSIYYDCLDAIIDTGAVKRFDITAFVYKKELFSKYSEQIELIELPKSRKSYLNRLYYEYCYFYHYSKRTDVDIWLSLHDITPKVKANRVYTYCHNPTPFMKKDLSKIKYSITNVAFAFFYKYLYRINIKSAYAVIVQQDWMRKEFMKLFPVNRVVVARPNISRSLFDDVIDADIKKTPYTFVFASYPRFFKNFEVIGDACSRMKNSNYEVWFTIDGTENKYAEDLRHKYGHIKNIKWLGIQSRAETYDLYKRSDCMIFPSTLETWGLPITEYKNTKKPIIVADLPYAHETVGTYEKIAFFNPNDGSELAEIMDAAVEGDDNVFEPVVEDSIEPPYANDWRELINIIETD